MRLLIQRVKQAQVSVNDEICGKIGRGLLVFLAIHKDDTLDKIDPLAAKLLHLRIFPDAQGKMNLNVHQIKGNILVISQFTLYANCFTGRRPDFTQAAPPELATRLYESFISRLSQMANQKIQTGLFGKLMEVSLINEGPATFFLEK
ncbi:MAG: D-aminoacyl-tRNA deacylase [Chlamydiales bacterium]